MKPSYPSSSTSLADVVLVIGLIILGMCHVGESGVGNPVGLGRKNPPVPLQVGFYNGRCLNNKTLDIQAFIEAEVAIQFQNDPTLLAASLRLQFHDCFVRGCDASILIEGPSTERTADANIDVRDFVFIDAMKAKVEAKCPGIVSCADIIAILTKVVLKLGGGPDYAVQTGRRDGLRSNAHDVNLPAPSLDVSQSFELFFKPKNFTKEEMVTLLGCHTVGVARCRFFENRLYNGTSEFDPNMDEGLRQKLIKICPQNTMSANVAFLDQSDEIPHMDRFDTSFYNQTVFNKGLLPIDQALARDPSTVTTVNGFISDPASFNTKLALVMVKLQAVDVLTGLNGNIRNVCSKFN